MPAYSCSLVRRDFGTQMQALFGPRATREMMSHGHKDSKFTRHLFEQENNLFFEANITILVLLMIYERLRAATGELITCSQELFAFQAVEFFGEGDELLFCLAQMAGTKYAALDVANLADHLDRVAGRVGMPAHAMFFARRDFGVQMSAIFGPQTTREMMGHSHKHRRALDTYIGGAQLRDVAQVRFGEVVHEHIMDPEQLRREESGFAVQATATGGGGGSGAVDVDEITFQDVIASSVSGKAEKTKRDELNNASIAAWAAFQPDNATLRHQLEVKLQAVRDRGGGGPFDVLNVWTRRMLTELLEKEDGLLVQAAKEALEAWRTLVDTKATAEKNRKTKKRRRKARDAARKEMPIPKDARQAALAELQRRKSPRLEPSKAQDDGFDDGGYGQGYGHDDAGSRQADNPFADDAYLVAESDDGPQFVLSDSGSGTPSIRAATAIARVARLDFLFGIVKGKTTYDGMTDACAELGVCLAGPATHKGALPTGAMPYSDGRFGGWDDKGLAAWKRKRISGMQGHRKSDPKLATRLRTGKPLPTAALVSPAISAPSAAGRHILLEECPDLRKNFLSPTNLDMIDDEFVRAYALSCFAPLPAVTEPKVPDERAMAMDCLRVVLAPASTPPRQLDVKPYIDYVNMWCETHHIPNRSRRPTKKSSIGNKAPRWRDRRWGVVTANGYEPREAPAKTPFDQRLFDELIHEAITHKSKTTQR